MGSQGEVAYITGLLSPGGHPRVPAGMQLSLSLMAGRSCAADSEVRRSSQEQDAVPTGTEGWGDLRSILCWKFKFQKSEVFHLSCPLFWAGCLWLFNSHCLEQS